MHTPQSLFSFSADYALFSDVSRLRASASGSHYSRDSERMTVLPLTYSALSQPGVVGSKLQNPASKPVNCANPAKERIIQDNEIGEAKSDGFVEIFTSNSQS
jgi:hypothetical protein